MVVESISRPWQRVALDVVGPFQRMKRGNKYILTMLDHGTCYMKAVPLPRVDARTTCDTLLETFSRFGVPEEVITDNRSNFVADLTTCLLEKLQCLHIRTSPYHPQTNGKLERAHATPRQTGLYSARLGCLLAGYIDGHDRTAPHSSLGIYMSPYPYCSAGRPGRPSLRLGKS